MKEKNILDRLLEKAKIKDVNNCWEWQAATASGYGTMRDEHMMMDGAHRISWRLFNNKWIPANYVVMHSCDNKLCINPNHLSIGSQKDNVIDMFKKNRQVSPEYLSKILSKETGEKNRNAKLNKEIVLEIRKLYSENISQREIARRLNVHYANVWAIVHNKSWSHI
jgi:predicted DNA-binding protein (UPF0251 family)